MMDDMAIGSYTPFALAKVLLHSYIQTMVMRFFNLSKSRILSGVCGVGACIHIVILLRNVYSVYFLTSMGHVEFFPV